MVHVVHVGENGTLTFSPDDLQVNAGDMVQFQFYPQVIDEASFQNGARLSNINPNRIIQLSSQRLVRPVSR